MAIIKRRIISRGRIAAAIAARIDGTDFAALRQAEQDAMFYMVADGKTVKIYHDVDMGGTVVEYDDE